MTAFKLPSGVLIPSIGFGVGTAWYSPQGNTESNPVNQHLIDSIKSAIKQGYTHLDAAEVSLLSQLFFSCFTSN